jgi:hypothetical protein
MKTTRLLPNGEVVTVHPDGSTTPLKSQTDWKRLKNMTDSDIETGALSDADNPLLSDEELNRLEPVPNLKEIRKQLSKKP